MEGRSYEYSKNSLGRGGTRPPLSPCDSVMSISQFRPSLVCLFNQLRQEDKEALTKEDLRLLLGGSVDSRELDAAFERLDTDKDGEICLDEFLAGFAQFLKEAPRTPAPEHRRNFVFSPVRFRKQEDLFETQPLEEMSKCSTDGRSGPSEAFRSSLKTLSAHSSRQSIEALWRNLAETNPQLVGDFEEFVAEIADEVEDAQRALNKQRLATKQEARELDEEIESRLIDAHSRLEIQKALVREQARVKLERRLVDKETELTEVKHKLEELESEVEEGQRTHFHLEQQCQELSKEKEELQTLLQVSEAKLERTQSEVFTLHQQQTAKHNGIHSSHLEEKEVELNRIKQEYEREISELREELESYQQTLTDSDDASLSSEGGPDAMATGTKKPRRPSHSSLLNEIMQQEGVASPMLRGEPLMHPLGPAFPSLRKSASTSLPNLARISRPDIAATHTPAIYIPVYVGGHHHPLPPIPSSDAAETMTEDHSDKRGERAPPEGSVTLPPEVDVTPPLAPSLAPPLASPQEDDVYEPVEVSEEEEVSYLEDAEMLLRVQPLEFIENLATQPDYVFKILVVGNSYVGKSSFLMRLCTNAFSARYSSTIGVDFYSKALRVDDKILSLQLWDTAGQERFQSVTKAYYRGAHGVMLMYDVSQEESFIAVKSWINSIQENTDEMPLGMLLVGNKTDLGEQDEREVSTETGETFSKIYGAEFIETSAKTGYNVGNALMMLVRSIMRQYEQGYPGSRKEQGIQVAKETDSKCCSR